MASGHEDDFLNEQLKRIRRLSDRISEARERVVQSREALEREMDVMRNGPLQQVRDYRTYVGERPAQHDARDSQTSRRVSRRRRR